MADSIEITKSTAAPEASNHEICMRSGVKFKRGTLIQEWTGVWVHPKYAEPKHPSDYIIPARAERLTGAIRPEADNIFITTEVLSEDL